MAGTISRVSTVANPSPKATARAMGPQNSVDSAHFLYLHGTQEMPTTTAEVIGPLLHTTSQTLMKTPQEWYRSNRRR